MNASSYIEWCAIYGGPYRAEGMGVPTNQARLTMDTMDGVRMLRESERRYRHCQDAPGLAFYHGMGVIENIVSTDIGSMTNRNLDLGKRS